MRRPLPAFTFVCALALMSASILAQQGGRGVVPAQNAEFVIATYNVADLVRQSRDYPLDSELHPLSNYRAQDIFQAAQSYIASNTPGGGNLFGNSRTAIRMPPPEMEALIKLITETVDPGEWKTTQQARIAGLGSVLVVNQTKVNQDKVLQLLNELRRSAGPAQSVTVRVMWVMAAPGAVVGPTTEVSADWISKQKAYCESQLTCFSGQTVHISSGQGRFAMTDVTPIVGTNAAAFDPQVSPILSGVTLQISPQLVPGGDYAIVDVLSAIGERLDPEPGAVLSIRAGVPEAGTTQSLATLDRVNMISQEFKTTARVPLRKKIIVGGMTLDPANVEQGGRQLYLVVEIDAVK